ncbi:MAG: carbonic anhydrase family protein [Cyanobacteria bacterium J06621_11]
MSAVRTLLALVIWLAFSLTFEFAPAAIAETLPSNNPAEIHWTYSLESGPDHWAELDDSFATCANGKAQSPIDLTGAASADLLNPEFHYTPAPLNLLNNGHTVQVPYAPGSYLVLEGDRYDLLQFHFHSPSEHAINSQPQVAELHLVHQNEAGELAVVAVMIKADNTSKTTDYLSLSENLPDHAGDRVRTGKMINAQSLLPLQTTTYRYSGSLTTPPCTESVTWLVMSEPISLTAKELSKYEQLLNHNNRPLQAVNSRALQIDTTP